MGKKSAAINPSATDFMGAVAAQYAQFGIRRSRNGKFVFGKGKTNMAMMAIIEDPTDAMACHLMGADKYRSQHEREKTDGWHMVSRDIVSPTVRNFQGISKRCQGFFKKFDAPVRVSVLIRTEQATICQSDMSGVGYGEDVWASQRSDGTFRVAGHCACYRDMQRLFILAQALAVVTENCQGYPGQFGLAAACAGETDYCSMSNNYSLTRDDRDLEPVSFRYNW